MAVNKKKTTATKIVQPTNNVGKSTTTTIGARPYSSPNATVANSAPVTTVNKGTNTSQVKNTPTYTNNVGKSTNTTSTMNVAPATTPKASTPVSTPVMNTVPTSTPVSGSATTTPKATVSNPIPAATYNPDAVGKGGYITAAPDKNTLSDVIPNSTPNLIDPDSEAAKRLNSYIELADLVSGAGTNQAAANMTPAQRTELLGSVLGAAPFLANNTAGYDSLLNVINQGKTRNPNLNRYVGEDEVDKAERELSERPYSNPNYAYQNYGFSDTRMIGPDYVGKGGEYETSNLLDALSNIAGAKGDYSSASGMNGLNGLNGTNGTNGTGSRSGGGTRGSALADLGDGYLDISALYDLLNQRLGEYDANYQTLLDSLNANYESMLNALGLNYADTEALLNGQLNNSRNELEAARRRQLQEAYISRMMQEKGLADMLDAYGLTGGATESVMADMRNNYANNRNAVEERVQNSLRDLLMNYLDNVTNARQRYNDSLLNAQNSRVNALNNAANYRSQARAGAYEDLYNTLANLTMKGINYGT